MQKSFCLFSNLPDVVRFCLVKKSPSGLLSSPRIEALRAGQIWVQIELTRFFFILLGLRDRSAAPVKRSM